MPECFQRWYWGRGGVSVGVTRGVVCVSEVGVGAGWVRALGAGWGPNENEAMASQFTRAIT